MACRIGMTTNVEERKQHWQSMHSTLYGWKVLGTYNSKAEAQQAENKFARQHDCIASPGGGSDEYDYATWYVYKFDY